MNVVAMWETTNLSSYKLAGERLREAIEDSCDPVLVDVSVNCHDGSETVEQLRDRVACPLIRSGSSQ